MNALVKKEVRLLLPSFLAAVLLAMVQGITRPYDFYVASLLFFGLTIMALTTIGREASLNTFSSMLAQPAERIRIWKVKLSVLVGAFLIVFLIWLAAFGIALLRSNADDSDRAESYNLFITICLIGTATFTGGLWTTLLLRQLAGAFWLTLLVPATLSGFSGIFLANSDSSSLVIAVLSVVIGVYSIAGFLFARWLFFRAQDVGWSGGVISVPAWSFLFARSENAASVRRRQPVFALVKKELQLHQVSLMGAAVLLVLHGGIMVVRTVHHFDENSSGAAAAGIFTGIVWMLWLVMAPVIGSMSVAEERRLGVMEGQLCLPVSRRLQFAVKAVLTIFLGVFLGGVMPMLIEDIGLGLGADPMFSSPRRPPISDLMVTEFGLLAFVGWLVFVGFFASTMAKSFLQAVGLGIISFTGCVLLVPVVTDLRMLFMDGMPAFLPVVVAIPTIIATLLILAYLNFKNTRDGWVLWRRNLVGIVLAMLFIWGGTTALYPVVDTVRTMRAPAFLPLILAVPTVIVTLLILAYLNFKDSREGWALWRRNLLGIAGALLFIWAGSNALYHRAWEVLEPAEPAHGVGKLSLANPPELSNEAYNNLVVRLPDGRVWFNSLSSQMPGASRWRYLWMFVNPLPHNAGPQRFLSGSNWVAATARHVDEQIAYSRGAERGDVHITGFAESVGVQADGTLWVSDKADQNQWTGDKLTRFGDETNWKQVVRSHNVGSVLLLKADGTLWYWGTNRFDWSRWPQDWPGLRAFQPYQIGTNSDWTGIYSLGGLFAIRADGRVWRLASNEKNGEAELHRWSPLDHMFTGRFARGGFQNWHAYVRRDGTLWMCGQLSRSNKGDLIFNEMQSGSETNWVAAANTWNWMVAIKSDGSLWQWPHDERYEPAATFTGQSVRLGIHHDWISLVAVEGGVVTLAADGSLWFWPDRDVYQYSELLIQLPKQPRFLGNVFSEAKR